MHGAQVEGSRVLLVSVKLISLGIIVSISMRLDVCALVEDSRERTEGMIRIPVYLSLRQPDLHATLSMSHLRPIPRVHQVLNC